MVALVAVVLGAVFVLCRSEAPDAQHGPTAVGRTTTLVHSDDHDHGCGHHSAVAATACVWAGRTAAEQLDLLGITALAVVAVASSARPVPARWRDRRQRRRTGWRYGRTLLVDVSVARI